jgi:hypothetical protein
MLIYVEVITAPDITSFYYWSSSFLEPMSVIRKINLIA